MTDAPFPPWSPRRLNRLAEELNARSYLEIGVSTGATFLHVNVPERTGVDPRYGFDTSQHTDEHTRFFAGTSDEFFAQLPRGTKFDLIFIDGLHTFEQTYRDLCSALSLSHPATAILIDDTLPSDVYSALPDPASAHGHRARTGSDDQSWHGDTYKVVYAIHDFHLGLDYRTIVDSGNPQTLVWQSAGIRRPPAVASMEALTRLSYFDLLESIDVLQCASEAEALERCLRVVGQAIPETAAPRSRAARTGGSNRVGRRDGTSPKTGRP
jgi:methyltransferase family protein